MPGSATILGVATAVPGNPVRTDDVKAYFPRAFDLDPRRLASIYSVIDNCGIDKRHMVFPLEYTITPRPLERTSAEYREHSITLGREAAEKALSECGLDAREVDLIITVSCTGFMIPSLDAYLINQMGFRNDVRRLPITELGCAAGAAAVGRASDHIRAFPNANVLIVAVELPSLTLQRGDPSPANLISCCLFGDGAAAMVMTGRAASGLRVLDVSSFLIPDSLDAMGFDLRSSGFHIVLAKEVPQIVREQIGALTDCLLARNQLKRDNLSFALLHPGGRKLLSYVEQELGLPAEASSLSWQVLNDYGNLSSATVLFVVGEFLKSRRPEPGSYGMLAAFGPGFSVEMAALQWV